MTYDYGGSSFDEGKQYYELAMDYVGQGRRDDARQYLLSAKSAFHSCTQNHPEAATYLNMVQQELQKLGG